MKNKICYLLYLFIVLLFTACIEEESPSCKFDGYDAFLECKKAWVENSSYSFKYQFCFGDSTVMNFFSVFATENPYIDYGDALQHLEWNDYYKDRFCSGNICFYKISDIFDFFDRRWKKVASELNTDHIILFKVEYETAKNGLKYPVKLYEYNQLINSSDSSGYGGVRINVAELEFYY